MIFLIALGDNFTMFESLNPSMIFFKRIIDIQHI